MHLTGFASTCDGQDWIPSVSGVATSQHGCGLLEIRPVLSCDVLGLEDWVWQCVKCLISNSSNNSYSYVEMIIFWVNSVKHTKISSTYFCLFNVVTGKYKIIYMAQVIALLSSTASGSPFSRKQKLGVICGQVAAVRKPGTLLPLSVRLRCSVRLFTGSVTGAMAWS